MREHVERSRKVAKKLAQLHGVDPDLVDLGVAAHDLARALDGESILREALSCGIVPNNVELRSPSLLHGPLAAAWIESDGVSDPQVLEAVRCHTTGMTGMGPVARVVYLADKLDPAKIKRHPALEEVEALACEDIDRALLRCLDHRIGVLIAKRRSIHPASVDFRNELLETEPGLG